MLDKKSQIQENDTNKYGFIIVAIFLIWLFLPNRNSFIQLCYWVNDIAYKVSKITHTAKKPEYIHMRNNAIYMVKIYPKKSEPAIKTINKAISLIPEGVPEREKSKLYKDRAIIKLYYGDKSGALQDYKNAGNMEPQDDFNAAILLADEGKYSEAGDFCAEIRTVKERSLLGYVCTAYIYEKIGNIEEASNIYDYLAEERPRNAYVYLERAYFYKRQGDIQRYIENFDKARMYSSKITEDSPSMIDEAVNFKKFPLNII